MKINSLAIKTDLFFHRFSGIVLEYENYLVVKTPNDSKFFWGNYLYFSSPPDENSLNNWKNLFKSHFDSMNVEHISFSWDSIQNNNEDIEMFLKDGFKLETSSVMMASEIKIPSKFNSELLIRPITSERDWEMVLENHVLCKEEHFQEESFRKFSMKKIANYRMMINNGLGFWMGAFLNDRLVGDLGLFFEDELGRFQAVGTHPEYRRQGVCSTLLYQTLEYARASFGISKFVIVANPDYHAINIYETVGFITNETQLGICKYNKDVWHT